MASKPGGAPLVRRRERGEKPQRALTAENLAHQRHQPFQARMAGPSARGTSGGVGREGALCSMCGMPGHDADVCADRPAPKLRLSVDVTASHQSQQQHSHVPSEGCGAGSDSAESISDDLPDSPSALFPKPSAADIARRLRAHKAAEAEADLRLPDAAHHKEAAKEVASKIFLHKQRSGGNHDDPTWSATDRDETPRPSSAAPTPLALRRPPPLPPPSASLDASLTDGLAGFAMASGQLQTEGAAPATAGGRGDRSDGGERGVIIVDLEAVDAAISRADAAAAAAFKAGSKERPSVICSEDETAGAGGGVDALLQADQMLEPASKEEVTGAVDECTVR
eukprot:CAMPEP_0181373912 /NCGR_PEP_ID=MMETSP1106-20121128/15677_1 /TAXON_ID=81844 /ORGANISM="Mantoniella antarctica, Strain SL-175" /LENGTH=337 /DNA_ID=CAMNT_0023491733 /DNA_START=239 /DNA_END=1249 /DNA_ORIENTATION=+